MTNRKPFDIITKEYYANKRRYNIAKPDENISGGKKMKRIIALLLVVVTVFAFAACKKNDTNDDTTNGNGITDADVIGDTVGEPSSDESTSDEATEPSTKNPNANKKPVSNKVNVGTGSTDVIKPDHDTDLRPTTKHTYVITVQKGTNGVAEIITIDGTSYNLKNSNDVKALKQRIEDEKANDLLGQIYDVDPTVAAQLGLSALDEGSVLSYKYDPEGEFFYVDDINSWQQMFGFNPLYDYAAGWTFMYYDTMRIYFDYQGRGYMLQLWKGQYGFAFIGSEIGFYEKDDNKPTSTSAALNHYECATDHLLPMEMVCYREVNGVLNPLFKRKYENHWWSTGFVPGVLKNFADRTELLMEARITFDNEEMAQIVGDTFKANKFKEITPDQFSIYNPDAYYVNGCDVVFTWRYLQSNKDVIILRPTTTAPSTSAPSTSESSSSASAEA